jgi:hypothetical protein
MNIKDLVTTGPANYFIYREQNTAFQDVGMYINDQVTVTGMAEPERVSSLRTTDGMIPLLGVAPLLASYLPSRRAARVNPIEALKAE